MRNNAAPGGAGHAEAAAKWWEERSATLLDGITEDQVRRQAAAQLAEFGARFGSSEYQWQEGARIGKLATDQQQASDAGANRARQMHDRDAYGEELSLGRQGIAMMAVPEDVREKLVRYHDQVVTVGYLNGLNDTNPGAALAMIDAGQFNDILTPQQIDQARSGAQVEKRRLEGAARTALNLARSEAVDGVELLGKRVAAGESPGDEEFAVAERKMAELGIETKLYDVRRWRQEAGIARETRPWLPQQYEAAIRDGRTSEAAGKASPEDLTRLRYLERIAPGRIREVNENPDRFLASVGMPPPALNADSPESWRALGKWADTGGRSLGRPINLLTKEVAAPIVATINQGGLADRKALARQLVNAGSYLPRVLDQVSSQSPGFRAAVALSTFPNGEALMDLALSGPDALKARPDLLKPATESGEQAGPTHEQIFLQEMARAARLLPDQAQRDLLFNATNIYAARAGQEGWSNLHSGEFRRSIRWAAGGRMSGGGWKGGLVNWRGENVIAPQGMTQSEFDVRLSSATDRNWMDAAIGAPAWANGRALSARELTALTPVMIRDGIYALSPGGNSYIGNRDGSQFRFDIRKLPVERASAPRRADPTLLPGKL
ncbi:MAG: hypothetical protein QHC65_04245 [Sphingomonas sp.]|nr:hypothetical protein [Sphingomonas sp.]MDX3883609.1 hypothetical protein [Sphingomonas sp.]